MGEAGEILGAREACLGIFGWEATALVGKNIRVLLKDGLDNEVGRFLHRHRQGKNPIGTGTLRVVAVRKDGIEFPAQVQTLTWSGDKIPVDRRISSRLSWTAAIQDLAVTSQPAPALKGTSVPASPPQDSPVSQKAPKTMPPAAKNDEEKFKAQTSAPKAAATAPVPSAPNEASPIVSEPAKNTEVLPAGAGPRRAFARLATS